MATSPQKGKQAETLSNSIGGTVVTCRVSRAGTGCRIQAQIILSFAVRLLLRSVGLVNVPDGHLRRTVVSTERESV